MQMRLHMEWHCAPNSKAVFSNMPPLGTEIFSHACAVLDLTLEDHQYSHPTLLVN